MHTVKRECLAASDVFTATEKDAMEKVSRFDNLNARCASG